jgi:hypothetical protein
MASGVRSPKPLLFLVVDIENEQSIATLSAASEHRSGSRAACHPAAGPRPPRPGLITAFMSPMRLQALRSKVALGGDDSHSAAATTGRRDLDPHRDAFLELIPDRKLETGPGTPGAQQARSGATQDIRASESNPNTPRHGTMPGRYQRRGGLSSGMPRVPEPARGRAGQTAAFAPATHAADRGRGSRQSTVRTSTLGAGHPPGRWAGQGALGGWALRWGAQVVENLPDDRRPLDDGKDLHRPAAATDEGDPAPAGGKEPCLHYGSGGGNRSLMGRSPRDFEVIEQILAHLSACADGKQGPLARSRPQSACRGVPVAVRSATGRAT